MFVIKEFGIHTIKNVFNVAPAIKATFSSLGFCKCFSNKILSIYRNFQRLRKPLGKAFALIVSRITSFFG